MPNGLEMRVRHARQFATSTNGKNPICCPESITAQHLSLHNRRELVSIPRHEFPGEVIVDSLSQLRQALAYALYHLRWEIYSLQTQDDFVIDFFKWALIHTAASPLYKLQPRIRRISDSQADIGRWIENEQKKYARRTAQAPSVHITRGIRWEHNRQLRVRAFTRVHGEIPVGLALDLMQISKSRRT